MIKDFCSQFNLNPTDRVLAAVSGGADSAAMLHLLNTLRQQMGFGLFCAHINHQLRQADSDEDERFVGALSSEYSIEFFSERVDVRGYAKTCRLSIETAARHLRLNALEHMARQAECTFIATAHHKNDQAETLLMRIKRGTSFPGLAGIHPIIIRNGLKWIRPILNLRRSEIEQYCRDHNLQWREDVTNRQLDHTRNWVRHCLLPHLQRHANTDIVDKLYQLSNSAYQMQIRLNTLLDSLWKKAFIKQTKTYITFQKEPLYQLDPLIAGELLRRIYTILNCGQRDLAERHYQRFFELLRSLENDVLELPGGCRIEQSKTKVIIKTAASKTPVFADNLIEIPRTGSVIFGNWTIHSEILDLSQNQLNAFMAKKDPYCQWFDLEQIAFPLIARTRKTGDSFVPFGMKKAKRVGKFLTDTQTDQTVRKQAFVVDSPNGILWLAPFRRSALAPIRNGSKNALCISISPVNS